MQTISNDNEKHEIVRRQQMMQVHLEKGAYLVEDPKWPFPSTSHIVKFLLPTGH